MTKRAGKQKTFIAERDIFDLLSAAVDLLDHASDGEHKEARLIRKAIRTSVADLAEQEAERLLELRIASLPPEGRAAEEKRIRAEVKARLEKLRAAAQVSRELIDE